MKISNGSSFEFFMAIIIFVSIYINPTNYWFNIPFGIVGLLIVIDCIIKWLKLNKKNEIVKARDDIKHKKSLILVVILISLLFNIIFFVLILFLDKTNNKLNKEKNCFKLNIDFIEENCHNFEIDEQGKAICSINIDTLKELYENQTKECK